MTHTAVATDPPAWNLARFARQRIAEELGGAPASHPPPGAGVEAPAAAFVTVYREDGSLQGCIGSLEARRSLIDDVEHNALAAAFYDPRAESITLEDAERMHVVVSILSPLEPLAARTEAEANAAVRLGVDGLVLQWGGRRATLLPQVGRRMPDAATFLRALKDKAGLPEDFWSEDLLLYRYTVRTVEDGGGEGD